MSQINSFNEYQGLAARTADMPGVNGDISRAVFALGLVCEATELQRLYTDGVLAPDRTPELITKELGDVMWYVAALCIHYDLSLSTVVGREIESIDGDIINDEGSLDTLWWVHSLTDTAGTVSDYLKKTLSYGPDHSIDKDRLSKGIQNVVISIHRVCVAEGLTLPDVMVSNIKKLEKRHPKGFTAESSLARADVSKPEPGVPMTYKYQYLHQVHPGMFYLDHRLRPEVRAMFCAMSSRMPAGGIVARYGDIVDAVAEGLWAEAVEESKQPNPHENRRILVSWDKAQNAPMHASGITSTRRDAEKRLCVMPLHPKVQEFFDKFVLCFGHSSILELTGSPSVYIQGVSYWAAMKSFGNPLVSGQEFSTRAIRRKDWPMAWECSEVVRESKKEGGGLVLHFDWHPVLKSLHEGWLEVFEEEVDAWKEHLTDPEVRTAMGIADKEPFRPALDRARWAIPGTISTGFAHTANLRTMARVIHDGQMLAEQSGRAGAIAVDDLWTRIGDTYAAALPGLSEMGLREAVYESPADIDMHLRVHDCYQKDFPNEVVVKLHLFGKSVPPHVRTREVGEKTYLDPFYNQFGRVDISFQCSLAVARDWHRHRTMMPWYMEIVWDENDMLQLHHRYEPKSMMGKMALKTLLQTSTDAYKKFIADGDPYRAMLCLPFGTKIQMSGQAGLRDAVYMLELRAFTHGASFEYSAQAKEAIRHLVQELGPELAEKIGLTAP